MLVLQLSFLELTLAGRKAQINIDQCLCVVLERFQLFAKAM
jgi:hypothetical protein